jgi:hypothetical protein
MQRCCFKGLSSLLSSKAYCHSRLRACMTMCGTRSWCAGGQLPVTPGTGGTQQTFRRFDIAAANLTNCGPGSSEQECAICEGGIENVTSVCKANPKVSCVAVTYSASQQQLLFCRSYARQQCSAGSLHCCWC